MGKIRKIIAIAKLLLLIIIAAGIPLLIYFLHPEMIEGFKSFDSVREMIRERGDILVPWFMFFQIFQVIVSIIPAQAIQIASGYIYNFWIAYVICITGLLAGTVITYFIAKLLGRDAMLLIFGEERIGKFVDKLNSKKAYIALAIIFLIPGLPKDLFAYAAGISQMKASAFFLISIVARTPAVMASILFGGMMRSRSYDGMIVMAVIIAALCLLGIKYHEKLADFANRLYDKHVAGKGGGGPE
jgi:uncharacterized membrane protein YdjX (TVP38/TMEM64 family)